MASSRRDITPGRDAAHEAPAPAASSNPVSAGKRRARRLRSALAVTLPLALVVAFASGTGCSTAKVNDAPDAKPQFECTLDPILFCNPLPRGTAGCVGFPDSPDSYLQRLPADKAYGEGCVANFVKRDVRIEDVCGLAAVCDCVRVDDAPDASAPPDAEADASVAPDADADAGSDDAATDASADDDAADASTPPPPPLPDAAPPADASTPVPDASTPLPQDAGPTPPARLTWRCR